MAIQRAQEADGPIFECDVPDEYKLHRIYSGGVLVGVEAVAFTTEEVAAKKIEALAEIKTRRDGVLKQYSEKLVIYQPNYDAAREILAGRGDTTFAPNGQTNTVFATNSATAMGLTLNAWCTYIVGEWQRLGIGVAAMENQYCFLTYNQNGVSALTTIAQIESVVAEFKALTGG